MVDGGGRLTIGKGLTARERIFRGMEQGLTVVAEQLGEPNVGMLLRKADLFITGANPGPACYGRGGTQPTVTDAALVLDYLNPACFLGGRMPLDTEAAKRAVGMVAERLGQTTDQTAQAILTIASEAMVQAIQEITVNEGVDPRESLLVAGGGAAGLNIIAIAQELGRRHVLIPRTAGALSACGAQYSDIVAEFSVSKLAVTSDFAYDQFNATFRSLHAEIDKLEAELGAWGVQQCKRDFFVEARYPTQVWELEVPLDEILPIGVLLKDPLPRDPPRHYMVQHSGGIESRTTRHSTVLTITRISLHRPLDGQICCIHIPGNILGADDMTGATSSALNKGAIRDSVVADGAGCNTDFS